VPNFDALATSFGALSDAFAWAAVVIAIVGLFGILGWGYLVKVWAEREARDEAERCAKKHVDSYMSNWLATEAPRIVRQHVENLMDASLRGNDEKAAEDIGKEAG
jgi:hypothetical protein